VAWVAHGPAQQARKKKMHLPVNRLSLS
jgi:hypothetical protein